MPTASADSLKGIVEKIFLKSGASRLEANRLAQHLVGSNLMGHDSHGVRVIPDYVKKIEDGDIVPNAPFEIVTESPSHAVTDGGWGFGQLAAWKATELAVEKARKGAVAVVTLRRANHIGRLGEYSAKIAEEGLIGFVAVNGHGGAQNVAPWGGLERRLSVNPFSWGIPGPHGPIMLDMSPTVVAAGKVAVQALRGESMPEGWVVDCEGRPTTDPNDYFGPPPGSLVPLGGHKGYALGFVVDILAGTLSGAMCSRRDTERWGNATFILAINIDAFVDRAQFDDEVSTFVEYVRSSSLAPGFTEILMPGEIERRVRAERLADNIYIEESTWDRLQDLLGG